MAEAAETSSADPLWDDWDQPPRIPDSPVLHMAAFDGPMDLLLELAERQRIDLGRISVRQLAEQFIAASEQLASRVPLERRADWMVMATRLVLLRSRLLSAADPVEVAAAEREAARQTASLEGLLALRQATAWLAARPQIGIDVFARPVGRNPRVSSYMALMEACLVLLRESEEPLTFADAGLSFRVPGNEFRMDAALARIRALLQERDAIVFPACLPRVPRDVLDREYLARAAVASSFVAVLELTRQGEAVAEQVEPRGALQIRPASVRAGDLPDKAEGEHDEEMVPVDH